MGGKGWSGGKRGEGPGHPVAVTGEERGRGPSPLVASSSNSLAGPQFRAELVPLASGKRVK